MFVSPAYAQAAGGGAEGFTAFLPLILIFVVFYFLLIRPQQKKAKQHREMLGSIRRGDKIVTGGGIEGTVTKVIDDSVVQVEIAEGIRVRVQRGMVAAVLSKTEPANTNDPKATGAGNGEKKTPGSMLRNLLGGKGKS